METGGGDYKRILKRNMIFNGTNLLAVLTWFPADAKQVELGQYLDGRPPGEN